MAFLKTSFARLRSVASALILLLVAPSLVLPAPHVWAAPGGSSQEYALKAAFLYNFCQYIEWPPRTFASSSSPIIIGIIGSNPFGSLLMETVDGERVRGRPIQLKYFRKLDDLRDCHILFISESERGRYNQILNALRGTAVVTVGESDQFIDNGGMIALRAAQNKVGLRINLAAVRTANVDMSSKLLRVADTR
jgi:hypothetical protein